MTPLATWHMFVRCSTLACLVFVSAHGSAQPADPATRATAVQLYDTAGELMAAGRYAEACPKFDESYRLDPQLGVALHLADCLEKAGRFASAYGAFRDAAEMAAQRGDERETVARDRAKALEPKLSRVRIEVPQPTPGMEIRRDGISLAAGSFGVAIPVDSGKHKITATAPDHEPWEQELDLAVGRSAVVTVPALRTASAEPVPPRSAVAAAPAPNDGSQPAAGPAPSAPPMYDGGTTDLLRKQEGVVVAPYVGWLVGSGTSEGSVDCTGLIDQVVNCSSTDTDLAESSLILGADVLFHVSPQLRLGADLAFLPSITVKPDEGDSASVGSELHFGAVVEVVVDVSPQVAMALRGGLGPALAFPGGDWADQLDSDVEACDSLVADGTATDCTVNEGPFIGGALNLGLGLLIPVATGTSLRVDLRYQKMIGPDLDQRLETSVGNATWSGTFDTNRGILAAGAEF